jgi:hypothetical protein
MKKEELIKIIQGEPNDIKLATTLREWYWEQESGSSEPYRPLPKELYIGLSEIEGNGIMTSEILDDGTELGISHVKNDSGDFHSGYIRTPLGGFVNHSEEPNCEFYTCGNYMKMRTIKDIKSDEELTTNYNLYKPCQNYIK